MLDKEYNADAYPVLASMVRNFFSYSSEHTQSPEGFVEAHRTRVWGIVVRVYIYIYVTCSYNMSTTA
jgi:hypothetical protein